jgi:hypothetical protein
MLKTIIFDFIKKHAMPTKTILSTLVIASILFISCKKEANTPEIPSAPIDALATTETAANNTVNPPGTPESRLMKADASSTNPNTIMLSNPGVATGAVNPAHGQPGHRCDIAVGAPLSAPKGQTPPQQAAVQAGNPVVQTTTTVVNSNKKPVAVAKGMNPAHGQAGHRCDIPVGSPLNAPVAKTTTPQKPAVATSGAVSTSLNLNPDDDANASNTSTTVATAPGMNPPHGQTGHRCDIAVGAALPKS